MPSDRVSTTAVAAVAVVLLLAGVTPLAVAPPASDGSDDSATFADEIFEDHRGDVVRVPVEFDGTAEATVRLGVGGSVATVAVVDEDDDARVTLRVNTYLLGRDAARAFEAAGADTAVVRDASASGTLPAGTYDLTVVADEEGAVSVVDDDATLRLREPAVRDLRVGVAEVDERANLTTPADVRAAMGTDRIQDRNYLVDRGLVVLELEAAGLSGVLAAQDGPNETARFFSLLERRDVTFTVDQDRRSLSVHESPVTFEVASHEATDVVADPANDTYYLLVDVDAAVILEPESKHLEEFESGDGLNLTVTVAADSNLTDGRETATAAIRRTEWDATVDDRGRAGELVVAPTAEQVVTGETNVPPGSRVNVVVRDRADASVVQSRNVTVGTDGRFAARVDLRELRDGSPIGVEVRFRDQSLAFRHGVVEVSDADVAVRGLRWDGSLAVVADATLEDDGLVAVHADSPVGPVLGYSEPLDGPDGRDPATYETVNIPLNRPVDWATDLFVVLHHDTPTVGELDFGDEPYISNGSVVATAVEVPVTASVTPSTSPTPPISPTASPAPSSPAAVPRPPASSPSTTAPFPSTWPAAAPSNGGGDGGDDGGDGSDGTARFAGETFEDHRGDVVRVPVTLDGTAEATVRLGDGGSVATVSVVDEDDDGRVTVRVNTYLLGRDAARAFEAAGADTASVQDASTPGTLPAGTYDLTVTAGEQATVDDEATLRLRERPTPGLAVWTAAAGERTNLTTLADVGAAKRGHVLQRTETPAMSGVVVLELEAAGLSGAVVAEDGPNATARFFGLLAREDVALEIEENGSTITVHEERTVVDVASHRGTTVVPDRANDTYYVVVDLAAAPINEGHLTEPEVRDRFEVEFAVGGDSELAPDGRETATASYQLVERHADVVGEGAMFVDPDPDEPIAGVTNVPPGYAVTVTFRATGSTDFEQSRSVAVGPDGRFEATFDLSDLDEGTPFLVEVSFRGQDLLESPVDGTVRRVDADLRVRRASREDGVLTAVANVTLPDDGFVVLRTNDGRERLATTRLEPDSEERVLRWSVAEPGPYVVTLHRVDDIGDDVDAQFVDEGRRVEATFDARTPTATPTATTPSTTTPPATTGDPTEASPGPPSTRPPTTTGSPTTTPTPGFGPLVVVFALAATLAWLGRQ